MPGKRFEITYARTGEVLEVEAITYDSSADGTVTFWRRCDPPVYVEAFLKIPGGTGCTIRRVRPVPERTEGPCGDVHVFGPGNPCVLYVNHEPFEHRGADGATWNEAMYSPPWPPKSWHTGRRIDA